MRAFVPLRVYGKERVPAEGGIVMAFNHFSWIDPPVFGNASPRTMRFLAKIEAHRMPGLGQLIRLFGTISVRRGESDREAVRLMRQVVRDGQALGLFAEGTRQRTGVPGKVQPGAAMVALQEDVPSSRPRSTGRTSGGRATGSRSRSSGAQPMRFDGLPKNGKGYREASLEIEREIHRLWRWLVEVHEAGRPDAGRAPVSARADELIGTVAIVGFPNVGKSTLVNRLTETRAAVVHETPGVTRDRKELEVEWNGRRFLVIDTGGIDIADDAEITRSIADQAREAVEEADLVLFVVDARIGTTPGDEEVAEILRLSHKPVLVLANKIDDPAQEANALEFHRLGLGDPIPLSAMHGHGTGDLLDDLVDRLEGLGGVRPELPEDAIRVAILGRPNVGKSSLLNALLGRERVIVSEVPGTTRDSIDTVLERDGRTFVLVDTAGLRRKRRHRQGSSTTRSCARSRPPSVRTSRSS